VDEFDGLKDAPYIEKFISEKISLFIACYQAPIAPDSWLISSWSFDVASDCCTTPYYGSHDTGNWLIDI